MAWTTLTPGDVNRAEDVDGNHKYVRQGTLLPLGGSSMLPTTTIFDIGSSAYHWSKAYIDEIANTLTVTGDLTVSGVLDVPVLSVLSATVFAGSVSAASVTSFPLPPKITMRYETPWNVNGGVASGSSTATLIPVNTITANNISGSSLTASQITVPSGTYRIEGHLIVIDIRQCFPFIYNTTASSTALQGSSQWAPSTGSTSAHLSISGEIFLSTQSTLEIRVMSQFGGAATNLGSAHGMSVTPVNNIFADFTFYKTG